MMIKILKITGKESDIIKKYKCLIEATKSKLYELCEEFKKKCLIEYYQEFSPEQIKQLDEKLIAANIQTIVDTGGQDMKENIRSIIYELMDDDDDDDDDEEDKDKVKYDPKFKDAFRTSDGKFPLDMIDKIVSYYTDKDKK